MEASFRSQYGTALMSRFYGLIRPALFALPAETAHRLAVFALANRLVRGHARDHDPILACRVWGLNFPNPIGLAAGFDKDARACPARCRLGFGFVEAGTVTPLPQTGNPTPRLFRLDADEAVINRLGFNSGGLDAFARRMPRRHARHRRRQCRHATRTAPIRDDYARGVAALRAARRLPRGQRLLAQHAGAARAAAARRAGGADRSG